MAEITATMVKELRERTGVGMMECRKALAECNSDMDAAIRYLRERGISKADAKSARVTREGIIFSYIHFNFKVGVLIELNCETDFVARTDAFKELAKELAMQIAATNPLAISKDQIDPEVIAREQEIARNKAINDGKKPEIIERIVEGHIRKFCEEHTLMEQELIKDQNRTVKSLITDAIASMGENIRVARFVRYSISE